MKLFAFAIVVLLGVIAYRMPSPIEIGRGIIAAEEERRDQIIHAQIKADQREEEKAQAEEAARRSAEDESRRVANLKPLPTPVPKPRATPDPRSTALDILHKYSSPK